jgi:hypothetical protein
MAKTTIQLTSRTHLSSKPRATKKRASGKRANGAMSTSRIMHPAGTKNPARHLVIASLSPAAGRGSGVEPIIHTLTARNSAPNKQPNAKKTASHVGDDSPSKRAGRKNGSQSNGAYRGRVAPIQNNKRKTISAVNTDTSMPSDVRTDHRRTGTLKSNAGAHQFPNELLQDYRIYRQLQTAIGRLNNQIKAIKKYDPLHGAILPLLEMYETGRRSYKLAEKKIVTTVQSMPIWENVRTVRGLAENSLGQILGETGDLSNYSNPAKLWQRMGLGMFRGHRQQNWSQDRKGFTKSENLQMAEGMGYSSRRRSLMHVVGSNLIRAKNPEYGKLYRDRKALELTKLPERDPATGKKNKGRLAHAHKRAMRYMEKRFLLNLWKAWRCLKPRDIHRRGAAMSSTAISQPTLKKLAARAKG